MIHFPESLLDSIMHDVISPKIEESQKMADLEHNMSVSLREFLKENVNNIFRKGKNLDKSIKGFLPTFFEDLADFSPRLRNLVGKNGGWVVRWRLWMILGSITDKLLYSSYYFQWESVKGKVLLSALKDCSSYFSQYFELLRTKEEVRVKKDIVELYDYLITIIRKVANDEEMIESLEKKRDSTYKSWLSSQDNFFRLKKLLQFSQDKKDFQIPRIPREMPKLIDENTEANYQMIGDNKKHIRVSYDLDFEDSSHNEIDIVIKLGSAMRSFIDELQSESLQKTLQKEILDQSQFNSFMMRTASEKYKILYRSFNRTCKNFLRKSKENMDEKDALRKFIKSVRLAEEFMVDCLQKYCEDLSIHQKVFAIHMADVASQALFFYKPRGSRAFVKKLLLL
jgi:hypothetical protein